MKNSETSVLILPLLFVLAACASSATSTGDQELAPEASAAMTEEGAEQQESGVQVEASFSLVQDEPVLARGAEGQWDSGVLRFPYVVQHQDQFHMFYEAHPTRVAGVNLPVAIGYASSEDGIIWAKSDLNPVLEGDGSGFDSVSVSRPLVSIDDEGTWIMYYAGEGEEGQVGIGLATATSPTGPWDRTAAPLLIDGPDGAWDDQMVLADQIIQDGDGYRMYYSGREASGRPAMIGLATSADGLTWEKFNDPTNDDSNDLFAESDPILLSGTRSWDLQATWTPNILTHNGGWIMVYNAFGSLGAAFSDDGVLWEKYEANPILRNSTLFHPFLVPQENDVYWIYYRDLKDDAIYLREGTLEFE